jgi:RNA-directed DNA polymerase
MSDSKLELARNNIGLTLNWNEVPWKRVYSYVSKLQHKIYKASRTGKREKVRKSQIYLINSLAAKLVAVHIVTTRNKGKSTAGIDRQIISNSKAKLDLAYKLKLDGKAVSIRRVWIPKPGKTEMRPLGIPSIEDRAKQTLAKLALEPQWEAEFEPNSYGFRPGRSCHDAIEAIFLSLHHNTPKWVYDADIRKCFDKINHDALLQKLNTFPLMRNQIKAWLKAGIMEGYANEPKNQDAIPRPTNEGTPQGGAISPLLANIALHGLETHLKNYVMSLSKPYPGSNRGTAAKKKALTLVRYADDFVLIHRNKQILEHCIQEIETWLRNVGLETSKEKSKLRDCRNGFMFLGFQIIQVRKIKKDRYKTKITPAKQKRILFLRNLREVVQNHKSSNSYTLINILRPKIIGWANYYKFCECLEIFSKMTDQVFRKLRAWAFRRSRKGRLYWKEKFFPSGRKYVFNGVTHKDNWILVGQTKGPDGKILTNFLPHMVWVASKKYVKVAGDESPFSHSLYWIQRSQRLTTWLPTRIGKLFRRQKGKCAYCKNLFDYGDMQSWQVDHVIPKAKGGPDIYGNIQLLHRQCHINKTRKDNAKYMIDFD